MPNFYVLDSSKFPSLTIQLIKDTLSDGSHVYNVRLWLGPGNDTMLAYADEKAAGEAYTAIVNALDKALYKAL